VIGGSASPILRALVVERAFDLPVPQLLVESVRAAMAAAAFSADPTASLDVVGITGTNGKTLTAFLVRELLEAGGRQTGLLGTVKSVVAGVEPVDVPVDGRVRGAAGGDRRGGPGMRDGGLVSCAGAP
jgi:UDP-N-acetylmuramyl tripeptide synthase